MVGNSRHCEACPEHSEGEAILKEIASPSLKLGIAMTLCQ